MNTNERFILKPIFGNLEEKGLKLKDILIYITIRSFHSSSNKLCYPNYTEISKLCGLSIKVIKPAIKRLEEAGYLTVRLVSKNWTKRVYVFDYDRLYQEVSLQHLFQSELTVNEKAFLLLTLEYALDESFDSPKDIAIKSGVSYGTCISLFKSLTNKGFLIESIHFDKKLDEYVGWISINEEKGIVYSLEPFCALIRQKNDEEANGLEFPQALKVE